MDPVRPDQHGSQEALLQEVGADEQHAPGMRLFRRLHDAGGRVGMGLGLLLKPADAVAGGEEGDFEDLGSEYADDFAEGEPSAPPPSGQYIYGGVEEAP